MVSIATLALVGLVAGAGAPAKPRPKPTPPPTLAGVVKDAQGKAVEEALVVAQCSEGFGAAPAHTRTDASGGFRLALRTGRPCDLRVEAKGLAPVRLERVRPGAPLTVTLGKGGVIEGTVRDGAGQPVPGARVEAAWGRSLTWDPSAGAIEAVTDAKGRFQLEGIGRGVHDVSARLRGAGRAQRSGVVAGSRLDLVLLPGASISGSVFGPDKKRVAGAVVRAEKEERPWRDALVARADAQGRFELAGLEAGDYRVLAHYAGLAPALVTGVHLEANAESEADVVLEAGFAVTGRLVGVSDKPVPGRVSVQELHGAEAPVSLVELLRAEAGEDGHFRIEDVPAGSHALGIAAPRHAPKRLELEVASSAIDVGEIPLEVGLAIRGRVHDRTAQPVAGARISGLPTLRGPGMAARLECESDPDGSFVLAGLAEGLYELWVSAPGFAPAKQRSEAGAERVEIVLQPGGAITGLVMDETGRPVEAYEVEAQAPDERFSYRGGEKSVTSAEGRFVLEDLNEGTYAVTVTAPDRAPAVVSGVRVASGGTTDAGRIRLGPGGIVRGTVADTRGVPVPGAAVSVFPASIDYQRGNEPQGVSDPAGAFEVRGVPAGRVVAIARHPQFAEARVEGLEVDPARAAAEARFVLLQGARVEGWVRRRDSTPLAGGFVQVWPRQDEGPFVGLPERLPVRPDGSFAGEHQPLGPASVQLMHGSGGRYTATQGQDVVLRDGETTTVEFVLREVLVSGRVTRAGAPAAGVRVTLHGERSAMMMSGGTGMVPASPSGPQRLMGVTADDGSYALLADAPGKHWARVETTDGRTSYAGRTVDVPDADTFALDFDLAGSLLTGIVVDRDTGQPIAQAVVLAFPKKGEGSGGRATTGLDGRFELSLRDGDYRVMGGAEGYARETTDVTVSSGSAGEVRLALERGLTILGRVVDARGRGVPSLDVSATLGGDDEGPSSWTRSLPDGSFQLGELQSRPYALFAGSGLAGFAFRSGVIPGDQEVVLTLRPGGRARLRIVGPNGEPAGNAWASVSRLGASPVERTSGAQADAAGVADLATPAGAVEITAFKDTLRGALRLVVPEGGTAEGEIRLSLRSEGAP